MSALAVYPNPAQDHVMLTYPKGMEAGWIELFDGQGRTLRTIALNGQPTFVEVALGGLPEGIYLARLILEGTRMDDVKFNVVK